MNNIDELTGVVTNIVKNNITNDISIKTECVRKNTPGIDNKIPGCDIILPEKIIINDNNENIQLDNPQTCVKTPDGWIIKFISNVFIEKSETCYIEIKTYDIDRAKDEDSSDKKEFPYIGRYWDLIQYLNDIKPKLVRLQHAYSFCPNIFGIMMLQIIVQNWENVNPNVIKNITEMINFLQETKHHLSIEIYPVTGQSGILTHRINNLELPILWSDIFEDIPNNSIEASKILNDNIEGRSGVEGNVVLNKGRLLSTFIRNLDFLHNLGIVIKDLNYASILFEGDGNIIFRDLQNSTIDSGNNWSRNINHKQSMNPEKTNMLAWYKIGKKMKYPAYKIIDYEKLPRNIPNSQLQIEDMPGTDRTGPPMPDTDMPGPPMPDTDMPGPPMTDPDMPGPPMPGTDRTGPPMAVDEDSDEIGRPPVNDKLSEIRELLNDNDIYDKEGNITRKTLTEVLTRSRSKKKMGADDPELIRLITNAEKYQNILKLKKDDKYLMARDFSDANNAGRLKDIQFGLDDCGGNTNSNVDEQKCQEFIDTLKSIKAGTKKTKKKKKKKKNKKKQAKTKGKPKPKDKKKKPKTAKKKNNQEGG